MEAVFCTQIICNPQVTHLSNTMLIGQVIRHSSTGLYFSAHWCPPCRGFTPKLNEIYTGMREAGKKIEIVFVSSDQDEGQFSEYYKDMSWLALAFENRDVKVRVLK